MEGCNYPHKRCTNKPVTNKLIQSHLATPQECFICTGLNTIIISNRSSWILNRAAIKVLPCWQIKGKAEIAANPELNRPPACSYQIMAAGTQTDTKIIPISHYYKAQWHPDLRDSDFVSGTEMFPPEEVWVLSQWCQHSHRILWKPRNLQWSLSVIKFFPLLFIYWLGRDKLKQTAKFLSPQGAPIAGLSQIQVDMAQLQSGKADGCLFTNGNLMPDRNWKQK